MTRAIALSRLAPGPSASFEQPFEMLQACHERVERMLALMSRLREHVRSHGADEAARQAARDVMRYFDLAAPQHHLDEERHVFPVLLQHADEPTQAVVRQLQHDHAAMETGWAAARAVLDALATGVLGALDAQAEQTLAVFAGLYGEHIRAEEGIAYPAARPLLEGDALTAMADDMMRRRGVR
jgi:hemerythrin-like domain-containing protein